jgi:hypothetical protein
MEIVDLVGGDRRSLKERESYMSESTLLCCSGGPILSLHHAIVRCGTAESNSIPLIVGAHAGKGAAPGNAAFEMVDMRRFEVGARRLVVAAVLVQLGDGIRIVAAVRGHRLLLFRKCRKRRRNCKWDYG